jgi:uncharacterized glyoxalase superfamily protein PhnB
MLTNRSAPPVTVTPVLVYPDVRAAVAWLESAFGFEERVRIGETHRAQLRVGLDGAVVVVDLSAHRVAPSGGGVTHIIKVRVPEVDAAFARALEAGARVVEELTTYEYGERSGVVEDLGGHHWELTQTVRDVSPEEWGGTGDDDRSLVRGLSTLKEAAWNDSRAVACAAASALWRREPHTGSAFVTVSIAASIMGLFFTLPRCSLRMR